MLRSLRSGADGVVAHKSSFKNALRNLIGERPPRPLHQRWLRDFFLMSRPPLLYEEGNIWLIYQEVQTGSPDGIQYGRYETDAVSLCLCGFVFNAEFLLRAGESL